MKSRRNFLILGIMVATGMVLLLPQTVWSQQQDELPEFARFRIGQSGPCKEANGFYRLKYSPDSKLLAARNRDNLVKIYDLSNQDLLCEVDGHENNWIETIDFSPDGTLFVTAAGSSEKVKIWNSRTGKQEGEIDTDASAAYFRNDGTQIVALGESDVEIYSWPDLKIIQRQKWKSGNDSRAGMSTDGNFVIGYQSLPRQIFRTFITNLKTKNRVPLDGPTGIPKSVAISNNGWWVAAAYHRDSSIRLWDLRDPHEKKYTLTLHTETVQSLDISPDGRFLITTGWDEKVIVWDLLTRQEIQIFEGHSDHVNAVDFSPVDLSFATAASGNRDCSILVWDLKSSLWDFNVNHESFDQLWIDLGKYNLKSAYNAVNAISQSSDTFLDWLENKTGDQFSTKVSKEVVELIQQLNSPKYRLREQATQDLIRIRNRNEFLLKAELQRTRNPEIKFRLARILETKTKRPVLVLNEFRRWQRLIFALELADSERAKSWLARISMSHEHPDISAAADEALERIGDQ
ncbi:MAG: hypothetical protein AAF939_04720 [Planctomycetota bacterium]